MKVDRQTSDEVKRELVRQLSPEDHEIYLWLRYCNTPAWIAETLIRSPRYMKKRAKEICKTLKVANLRELAVHYGSLDNPCPTEENHLSIDDVCHALAALEERYSMAYRWVKE